MNSHPDDARTSTTISGASLSERDRLATASVINALASRTAMPASEQVAEIETDDDGETIGDHDSIESTDQARSLTESTPDLSHVPDDSDGALFDGDQGQLDAKLRILLVKLLKNRYLSAEDNSDEWDLLIENQDLLRSRCHDLLLELVIDVNYGVAFKRQADSDEGASWPTLLHDVPYTREQTAVLLFLRGAYRNHINKGEAAAFVDREEMLAEVETYLPQEETQRARSSKSTLTAIEHLCRIRILLRTDSPDRFRISPIIEVILSVDVLRHLERLLMGEAISAGAEAEVPEILRTVVTSDVQLPATVEGDQLTVDGGAIPWRDTMPDEPQVGETDENVDEEPSARDGEKTPQSNAGPSVGERVDPTFDDLISESATLDSPMTAGETTDHEPGTALGASDVQQSDTQRESAEQTGAI